MTYKQRYTIVIEACQEGGYHAWSPSFPGCHSQGETLEETKKNIIEAIQCQMESLLKDGEKLPHESEEFVGSVEISVSA